jgi:hypothetical protein
MIPPTNAKPIVELEPAANGAADVAPATLQKPKRPRSPLPPEKSKPRRPRTDGLTYTRLELCWALGLSLRQLDGIKYDIPKPLSVLGRRPRWSRRQIAEWLEQGGKARR